MQRRLFQRAANFARRLRGEDPAVAVLAGDPAGLAAERHQESTNSPFFTGMVDKVVPRLRDTQFT